MKSYSIKKKTTKNCKFLSEKLLHITSIKCGVSNFKRIGYVNICSYQGAP